MVGVITSESAFRKCTRTMPDNVIRLLPKVKCSRRCLLPAILSRIDELGAGGLFGARRPFAKFHRCRAVALSGHWRFALVHLLGWPRS
jgi:hypothetical protein